MRKEFFFSYDQVNEIPPVMDVGLLQLLIPIYIENFSLWIFQKWGNYQEWEPMTTVSFSFDSVQLAMKAQEDISIFYRELKKYVPNEIFHKWILVLEQWMDKIRPVEKKENLTFYSVINHLHIKLIEEQWPSWWDKTNNGVVIEQDQQKSFEKLLHSLGINIHSKIEDDSLPPDQNKMIITSEFPELTKVFPELDTLPKQWFLLTNYEEKTLLRLVKQAIVLQLWLKIELANQDIIIVFPTQCKFKNGRYEVITEDQIIAIDKIKKVAIILPLEEMELESG